MFWLGNFANELCVKWVRISRVAVGYTIQNNFWILEFISLQAKRVGRSQIELKEKINIPLYVMSKIIATCWNRQYDFNLVSGYDMRSYILIAELKYKLVILRY